MTGDYKECQDGWEEVRFLLRGVGYLIGLVLLLGLAFLGWWFCTPLHKFKFHMLSLYVILPVYDGFMDGQSALETLASNGIEEFEGLYMPVLLKLNWSASKSGGCGAVSTALRERSIMKSSWIGSIG